MDGLPLLNPDAAPPPASTPAPLPTLPPIPASVIKAEVVERPLVVGSVRQPSVPTSHGFPRAMHRKHLPPAPLPSLPHPLSSAMRHPKLKPNAGEESEVGGERGEGREGGKARELPPEVRAQIDRENLARLEGMSDCEIQEAREQLLKTLGPSLVKQLTRPAKPSQEIDSHHSANLRKGIDPSPSTNQKGIDSAPSTNPNGNDSFSQTKSKAMNSAPFADRVKGDVLIPTGEQSKGSDTSPARTSVHFSAGSSGVPTPGEGERVGGMEACKMEWMGDAADAPPPPSLDDVLPAMGKRSVEEALAAAAQVTLLPPAGLIPPSFPL